MAMGIADRDRFGLGRVFRDIDEIEPGLDFVEAIEAAMEKCHACLVLIGPHWLTITDAEGQPRIGLDTDFVGWRLRQLSRGTWSTTSPVLSRPADRAELRVTAEE
jgi:hypothetical protein